MSTPKNRQTASRPLLLLLLLLLSTHVCLRRLPACRLMDCLALTLPGPISTSVSFEQRPLPALLNPMEAPYLAPSWRRHGSCCDHCWASHTGLPPCSDRGGITHGFPWGEGERVGGSGGGQTKFPSRCVVPLVVRPWPHSEDMEAFLRWPVKNVLSYASCLSETWGGGLLGRCIWYGVPVTLGAWEPGGGCGMCGWRGWETGGVVDMVSL